VNNNNYNKLLLDPRWKKLSKKIKKRDGCCIICGSKTNLEVHHIKYTGLPWEAPITDLITFCYGCHQREHTRLQMGLKSLLEIRTLKYSRNKDNHKKRNLNCYGSKCNPDNNKAKKSIITDEEKKRRKEKARRYRKIEKSPNGPKIKGIDRREYTNI
jgi:hypothetical protein